MSRDIYALALRNIIEFEKYNFLLMFYKYSNVIRTRTDFEIWFIIFVNAILYYILYIYILFTILPKGNKSIAANCRRVNKLH